MHEHYPYDSPLNALHLYWRLRLYIFEALLECAYNRDRASTRDCACNRDNAVYIVAFLGRFESWIVLYYDVMHYVAMQEHARDTHLAAAYFHAGSFRCRVLMICLQWPSENIILS